MTQNQRTAQPAASTTAGAWGLRYPALVMAKGGKNEVKEFTGMWRLNPDADLVAFTKALRRAAGSIHRKIVLEDDHALGPDPHGAPVRRADAGTTVLELILMSAVRPIGGTKVR